MKNLHLLKVSNNILSAIMVGVVPNNFRLTKDVIDDTSDWMRFGSGNHLYITSDEPIQPYDWMLHNSHKISSVHKVEAIVGDYVITLHNDNGLSSNCKKVILTTDQELIKDGVQAIDDEFLEWFVKNPSCEEVETKHIIKEYVDDQDAYGYDVNYYKITIPKEEQTKGCCGAGYGCGKCSNKEYKQELGVLEVPMPISRKETLEEVAFEYLDKKYNSHIESKKLFNVGNIITKGLVNSFVDGAKWQEKQSYSEEEVLDILGDFFHEHVNAQNANIIEWFEQFKKK
jgi:hypothetical protein